jgi:hypothetical protein
MREALPPLAHITVLKHRDNSSPLSHLSFRSVVWILFVFCIEAPLKFTFTDRWYIVHFSGRLRNVGYFKVTLISVLNKPCYLNCNVYWKPNKF